MSDFQKFLDDNLGSIHLASEDMIGEPSPVYDIYEEIRESIVSLRREQHMTQKELAIKTGITQANLCNLEKGITRPTIDSLRRIADATGTRLVVEFTKQEVL